ncbi:M14 family metallopeptidase [soil metagenome]
MGFRSEYLGYDAIEATLRAWAALHPNVVRVESIGKSAEGRDLLLLIIGPDPERMRPAAWIDGNMHATEVCGSSVALAIAEDVIALHTGKDTVRDLPKAMCDRLRETLFYVLPRMCPDGAETVLREGRYVRSNPRDRRAHAPTPRWIHGDVDGDGKALLMRKESPHGDFVEAKEFPGLMLPRTIEDEGPFFEIWPEGTIENWNGHSVPDPHYLSDNDVDLNRNFPWTWMPEPTQVGAGAFAASEPESRAVVEWTSARTNIFTWLNLHTFGGVYIRPLGNAPDSKMEPMDLGVYRQVAEWGQTYGGYPTVSGFHEFLYEPDKPLYGDLADFAYHHRGAIGYVCELWDLFAELKIERKKPFVDHYSHITRAEMLRFAEWDRDHNASRVFVPWRKVKHPQLGDVSVGGMDIRVGLSNPPLERIAEVCERQSKAFLRVAAMAPALRVRKLAVEDHGDARAVHVTIDNDGYLPTYVLSSAKKHAIDARVFAEAECTGATLVSAPRVEVGHLEGWGRGLWATSIFHQRSDGNRGSFKVTFLVRGKGTIRIRAHGLRVGAAELVVEV